MQVCRRSKCLISALRLRPKKAAEPVAKPAGTEEASADKAKLSKNQLKKLAKKEKEAAPAPAAEKKAAEPAKKPESKKEEPKAAAAPVPAKKAPSKKQTLPSGLVIEDNKVGTGAAAKAGQRVSMRYIGRLNKCV